MATVELEIEQLYYALHINILFNTLKLINQSQASNQITWPALNQSQDSNHITWPALNQSYDNIEQSQDGLSSTH